MADFKRTQSVRNGIEIDGKTGIIRGDVDPSLTAPMLNVPRSTIYIRKNPDEIWQKTGDGDTDYTKVGSGTGGSCDCTPMPGVFLPFLLTDLSVVNLYLDTQNKLPLILSGGTQIGLVMEI